MGRWVTLKSADGFEFPAWEAQCFGTARMAVVVVQEIFGVNAHIHSVADRFAARGYHAVAPAMFSRVRDGVDLGYEAGDMAEGVALKAKIEHLPAPGVLPDLQAAIDHAARISHRKVGITGFCWGGLLTWRAACELTGLSAAAAYYGGGMTTPAEVARQPRVPVMAHFGRKDQHIPLAGVEQFASAHPEVQVHLYDAGHGFHCDARASYDETAAALARERTLAFFDQHLA